MKTCPNCHHANSEFKQYCVHCGAPLPKATASSAGDYAFGPSKNLPYGETEPVAHQVTFKEAIHICLKEKYATFTGRARRSEFWYFCLFSLLASTVVLGICAFIAWLIPFKEPDAVRVFTYIGALAISLLLLSPALAVVIRRLHDTGKSGWWTLLIIIPVANMVVIIFTMLPSDPNTNKYGPRP